MLQLCSSNAAASAFAHMAATAATGDEGLAERMHKLAAGTSLIRSDAASIWGAALPLQGVARVLHEALGRAVRAWLATGLRPLRSKGALALMQHCFLQYLRTAVSCSKMFSCLTEYFRPQLMEPGRIVLGCLPSQHMHGMIDHCHACSP